MNKVHIALLILSAINGVALVVAYRAGRKRGAQDAAASIPVPQIVVPPAPVVHEDRSRIVNWAWQAYRTPAPWFQGSNVSEAQRSIVARALADVGICELPYAGECLAIAGVSEEMIPKGLQSWGSSWVGRVWRDAGLSVPTGYAGAHAWLQWQRRPISTTPEPGAVAILGSRERPRVAIVARSVPYVVLIEVIEGGEEGGEELRDRIVVARCLTDRDRVLGYQVALSL